MMIIIVEPNKEKTDHNGSVSEVVNHSPKSHGSGLMSPGSAPPPGSVPLPGLVTHNGGHSGHSAAGGVSVTVSNGSGRSTVYSPDQDHSPPTPQPTINNHHHQRPVSLKPGGAPGSGKSSSSGGKRTRWLLCYHMGGGAPSASPSPPSETGGNSQCSTPSPTDHGFKLPNSFSNERPTSLPVALLNCSGNNSDNGSIHGRGVVGESNNNCIPLIFFSSVWLITCTSTPA